MTPWHSGSRREAPLLLALADSLLSAIVRADGDALVMHVGERPYVVVGQGPLHISTHELTLDTTVQMMTQLLTAEALASLERSEERRVGKECRSRWWAHCMRERK